MGLTYLDSSVLIDATVATDEQGDAARELIARASLERQFVTSALVDFECLVRPLRSCNEIVVEAVRGALARFKHLEMPARAFSLAAHLRANHGFQTPDALHVATASLGGCEELWTRDRKLLASIPSFAVDPFAGP